MGWFPASTDWLLNLSSATDEVRPHATVFIQIICTGFILQCIGLGVNNFIRTCGAPNRALGTMVIGLVSTVMAERPISPTAWPKNTESMMA